MEARFRHYDLKLIEPKFGGTLTGLIMELEHLRRKRLERTTPPLIFFQLKRIFHRLESIGSARIEGNNTTVAEYMETKIEDLPSQKHSPSIQEIENIEHAMTFIEEEIPLHPISRVFISELHKLIVEGLPTDPGEGGDDHPGAYRTHNVRIAKSLHLPPESFRVPEYMDELLDFIRQEHPSQFDLLKVALAHHRFVWIHPFGNGNGRTVRLFTYALLLKYGFDLSIAGRIVNPTAVFCNDRHEYYDALSKADEGAEEGLEAWCTYVLSGLKEEIKKVDRLSDYEYLKRSILLPALEYCQERQLLTREEAGILAIAIEKKEIQNRDIQPLLPTKSSSTISNKINDLKDRRLLQLVPDHSRRYCLRFDNGILLRGVIYALGREGFLPNEADLTAAKS